MNNDAIAMLTASVGPSPSLTLDTIQKTLPMVFQCIYGLGDLAFCALFTAEFMKGGKESGGAERKNK